MTKQIELLLVEDNPVDRDLVKEHLGLSKSAHIKVIEKERIMDGVKILNSRKIDLLLLDLSLPDSHGLGGFNTIQEKFPELPIIILTGLHDDATALHAIRNGAQDYLVKGEYHEHMLEKVIQYAMERKKIELLLEKQKATAELYNRELEQFAYIAAHDLRGPIVNISCLLDLIEKEVGIVDGARQYFDKLKIATSTVQQTIEALNEIVAFKNSYVLKENLDLRTELDTVLQNIDQNISNSGATIEADFSEMSSIYYSKLYVNSIFQNLITNAIKFARPGVNPAIEIKSYRMKNRPCLMVSDNGIGIDLEKHSAKLFRLFQRFELDRPGKGIGLHMIKYMVVHQGGKVEVESQIGVGTTFRLTLN